MTAPRHLQLTAEVATALSVAATYDRPGIVVLVFDDQGLLVAVRLADDYAAATITADCRMLLDVLAAQHTPGPAIVVTVQPGFGRDEAAAELPQLRQCFEAAGCALLDWLLVDAEGECVGVAGEV